MKKVLKVIVIIVIVIAVLAATGIFFITRGLKEGAKLVINDVSVADFKDGKCNGIYKEKRWLSEVDVIIKDHKITKIQLLSEPMANLDGLDFSNTLFKSVIDNQTPNVDVISGATVTSKAYLKSIENALTK